MLLSQYLDQVEEKLCGSFNIQRDCRIENDRYDLFAEYHLRGEKYIAVKKAVIYAIESHEYCMVKYIENLDNNELNAFVDALTRSARTVVKPSSEHMSSIVTGVIVADNIVQERKKEIVTCVNRFKCHRGFALGLKGWMDIRLLVVSLKGGLVAACKKGKEVSAVYQIGQ
jgi:hypothetical protein